jgi:hypothetical protein
MAPEEVIQYLTGEQIVGGAVDVDEEGFHLYTRNGLILVFVGTFGIMKTDQTVSH